MINKEQAGEGNDYSATYTEGFEPRLQNLRKAEQLSASSQKLEETSPLKQRSDNFRATGIRKLNHDLDNPATYIKMPPGMSNSNSAYEGKTAGRPAITGWQTQ